MDTRPNIILRTPADLRVTPHLLDCGAERTWFSWEQARGELAGLPNSPQGSLNIAYEAVDRHLNTSTCEHVAERHLAVGVLETL